MGILNKLMFWKKEDDFDFDRMTQQEMGKSPSLGPDPLAGSQGFPDEKSAFGSDPFSPKPTFGQPSTSLELMSLLRWIVGNSKIILVEAVKI